MTAMRRTSPSGAQDVHDAPGVQVRQRHPGHGGERGLVVQRVGQAAADLGQEREAVAAGLRRVALALADLSAACSRAGRRSAAAAACRIGEGRALEVGGAHAVHPALVHSS